MSKDIEKLEADAAKYEQTEREVKNSLKQKVCPILDVIFYPF